MIRLHSRTARRLLLADAIAFAGWIIDPPVPPIERMTVRLCQVVAVVTIGAVVALVFGTPEGWK